MPKTRTHIYVSGFVQGVFFRQNTKRQAQRLGVAGWVQNLADGRVEAVFEGEADAVKTFVDWCRRGPASARVDNVEVKNEAFVGEFADFTVR
jgi:acylphosphatase